MKVVQLLKTVQVQNFKFNKYIGIYGNIQTEV